MSYPVRLFPRSVCKLLNILLLIACSGILSITLQSVTAQEMPQPLTIEHVGSLGGEVEAVAVNGNYAYLGEGSGLTILDISNPDQPVQLSRLLIPGIVSSIHLETSYAYVASFQGGVYILDIRDPTAPTIIGTTRENPSELDSESANDIDVVGDYAYITGGDQGVEIIDISDPTNPSTVVSEMITTDMAIDVEGNYAYVAANRDGLQIIDLSNLSNLTVIGSFDTLGNIEDVHVEGGYAYIADDSEGLQIIDIGNPADPTFAGSYNTSGYAHGVDIVGRYAYVADDSEGLHIIDISNPTVPTLMSTITTPGDAHRVHIAGNYAYVTMNYTLHNGLQIIDISNPASPLLKGSYKTPPDRAYGVQVIGNYAYVSGISYDFQIIDISDPPTATVVGSYGTTGRADDVQIVGDLAYITGSSDFQIIDISSPTAPSLVGHLTVPNASYLDIVNDYAYIAAGAEGLQIVAIGTPSAPILEGSLDTPGSAADVHIDGDYAYIADGSGGLRIIDIHNPSLPVSVGSYTTLEQVIGVDVVDNYAYLASGNDGLVILDVSIPSTPTVVGSYDTFMGSSRKVQVEGTYAYLADGDGGIRIIDISDPANPTLVGSHVLYGETFGLSVANERVYAADQNGGLQILQVTGTVKSTLSGTVTDNNNTPVSGVTITTDTGVETTTTSDGSYTLADIADGTYTLTPSKDGCTFSPTSIEVTVPPDATGQDFTATCIEETSTISGTVTDNNNTPVSGVTITTNTGVETTTTSDGSYTLPDVADGTYTLTPSKDGCTFDPPSLTVRVPPDATGQDFIAIADPVVPETSDIAGTVTDEDGNAVAGVTIAAGSGGMAMTTADGSYTLADVADGTYTLTPAKDGCTFSPTSIEVTVPPDATGQDFTATCIEAASRITGQVTDQQGDPLAGVIITDGDGHVDATDANGGYELDDLRAGTYTLRPSKQHCTFSPSARTLTVPPDQNGQDFTATCAEPRFSIAGRVTDDQGMSVSGVVISDQSGHTTTSDSRGYYTLSGLSQGTYTLTPFKQGYTFRPATVRVNVVANVTGQHFTAILERQNREIDLTISLYHHPRTAAQRQPYERILGYFADGIYEASNGAHKLGTVRLYPNGAYEDTADVQWEQGCHPRATVSGYGNPKGYITMCDAFVGGMIYNGVRQDYNFLSAAPADPLPHTTDQRNQAGGYTLAHEGGHYFYSLRDEYKTSTVCTGDPMQGPCASDIPVENSIMNSAWQAIGGHYEWLNFSTPINNTRRTSQHRTYLASGWETLRRPISEDPRSGTRARYSPRLYYPELAAVAPAPGQAPRIDLVPGHTARSDLRIIWGSGSSHLAQQTPQTVQMIVIDTSAGMAVDNRLAMAQQAVQRLLDRAVIGRDAIGIITVDDTATVLQPLTVIDSEATRESLKQTIATITPGQAESVLGDAAQAALTAVETFSNGEDLTRRVTLLSGSKVLTGTSPLAVLPDYRAADVSLFTIGYGVDASGVKLLTTLATETDGAFWLIPAPAPSAETTSLIALIHALTDAQHLITPAHEADSTRGTMTVQPATPAVVPIAVDSTMDTLDVTIHQTTSATATLTLLNPQGQPVGGPDCATTAALSSCTFTVITPTLVPGEWTVRAEADDAPVDLAYRATGSVITATTFAGHIQTLTDPVVTYPTAVPIIASIQRDAPLAHVHVQVLVEAPDGTTFPLTMRDDGHAPDDQADDGRYAGLLDYTQDGIYTLTAQFDTNDGNAEETYASFDFVPTEDGRVDIPDPQPVGPGIVRVATTQVYVTGTTADDHANTLQQATELLPNNTNVAGRIETAGDTDVFSVTATAAMTLAVRVSDTAFALEPRLRVVAADGTTELATITQAHSEHESYLLTLLSVQPGETLTLEVTDQRPDAAGGIYDISAGPPLVDEAGVPTSDPSPSVYRVYLPTVGQ